MNKLYLREKTKNCSLLKLVHHQRLWDSSRFHGKCFFQAKLQKWKELTRKEIFGIINSSRSLNTQKWTKKKKGLAEHVKNEVVALGGHRRSVIVRTISCSVQEQRTFDEPLITFSHGKTRQVLLKLFLEAPQNFIKANLTSPTVQSVNLFIIGKIRFQTVPSSKITGKLMKRHEPR